jgi:hypothetical protein
LFWQAGPQRIGKLDALHLAHAHAAAAARAQAGIDHILLEVLETLFDQPVASHT